MTIGSWLARKLSDPEFEAWLDERIKVATKAAVVEALDRLDEEKIALAVADRVVDKTTVAIRGELAEVVAAVDGRIDQVLGMFERIPEQIGGAADRIGTSLLGGLVAAGKGAGVGNVTLGGLLDNLLDGKLPFRVAPPGEPPR